MKMENLRRSDDFGAWKMKQGGQIIIILLLLMLVGLSLGLAYTQRSISDVSTSTQAEQSGRAFSAAEAGIEKALSGPVSNTAISLGNNATAQIESSALLPLAGSPAAVEYPPIGRETTAQFWFVDPSVAGPPTAAYNPSPSRFTLYYGNEGTTDLPAVEVSVVIQSGGNYYTKNYYYDSNSTRAIANNNTFTGSTCNNSTSLTSILGTNRKFFCSQLVPSVPLVTSEIPNPLGGNCGVGTCKLILARIRFLYVNENHSLAVAPTTGSLPPQVQIYNSLGSFGQSQKLIQAFSLKDVVPPWFDFALFSVNELRK